MKSPAYHIAQILQESPASLGTIGQTIFVGREPDTPDNTITIYDTGGFEPEPGYTYERPTVMIRVRNVSYEAGFTIAQECMEVLNGLYNVSIGSYRYIGIWALNGPNGVGRDDNNRALFTVNLRLHRSTA